MSATGQGVSGAEQMALYNQGMTQQNQYYQQDLSNLMTLSGANANPAAGGQAAINATGQQNQATNQGIGGLFSGGSNSTFNQATRLYWWSIWKGTQQTTATTAASAAGTQAITQPSNYGSVATGYGV